MLSAILAALPALSGVGSVAAPLIQRIFGIVDAVDSGRTPTQQEIQDLGSKLEELTKAVAAAQLALDVARQDHKSSSDRLRAALENLKRQ